MLINDEIDPVLSSLLYTSIDHLSALIFIHRMLVKAVIKEANYMIPVYYQDQILYVMVHCSYIDRMFLFGLHSTPKNFPAVADGLN